MSISNTNRVAGPYTGNGVTVAFGFSFKVFQAADVQVIGTDLGGAEYPLTLNVDYTITLNTNQDSNPGGTVTMAIVPASGYLITLTSTVANLQPTTLTNNGGFYPSVINDALDRVTILVQQLAQQLTRAAKVPISGIGSLVPSQLVFGIGPDGLPALVTFSSLTQATALITSFGSSLLSAVNAGAAQTVLGFSAYFKTLVAAANPAEAQTTLGLGSAAVLTAGTAATNAVQLDASAKLPAVDGSNLLAMWAGKGFKNLRIVTSGYSSPVSITATELILRSAAGAVKRVTGVLLSVQCNLSGVNGLDTGTLANRWYTLWVICNSSTDTVAGLLSTGLTAPTALPSGYDFYMRVGWIKTDSSVNNYPYAMFQTDELVFWRPWPATNMPTYPKIVSGVSGAPATPTWTIIDVMSTPTLLSYWIPETAVLFKFIVGNGTGAAILSSNGQQGGSGTTTNPPDYATVATVNTFTEVDIWSDFVPGGVFYAAATATAGLYIKGWQDSL
jgi:hypothetical protein